MGAANGPAAEPAMDAAPAGAADRQTMNCVRFDVPL
jgi:hypothetical protein